MGQWAVLSHGKPKCLFARSHIKAHAVAVEEQAIRFEDLAQGSPESVGNLHPVAISRV